MGAYFIVDICGLNEAKIFRIFKVKAHLHWQNVCDYTLQLLHPKSNANMALKRIRRVPILFDAEVWTDLIILVNTANVNDPYGLKLLQFRDKQDDEDEIKIAFVWLPEIIPGKKDEPICTFVCCAHLKR